MIKFFQYKPRVRVDSNGVVVISREASKESDDSWWSSMSESQQEKYLEEHPNSRKAKEAREKETENKQTKTNVPTPAKHVTIRSPKFKVVRNYKPDVDKTDKDGITLAARVGLAGKDVPPPPGIPRLANLTKEEQEVQDSFANDFEQKSEEMTNDFLDIVKSGKKPPTFGTDDAKILSAAWSGDEGEDRSSRRALFNTALHQTANAIAKRAFMKHLDSMEKGQSILVTVGGCGAGKGYSLKNVPVAQEAASKCHAVWDSAGDQNATENPWIQEEAEKRGLNVTYVFVNADPEVSWADPARGAIKRANDPKDGRMVDAYVFADSYAIGAKNHAAFADANKDNPNAAFLYIDSAGKAPTLVDKMPESALKFDRKKLASFALDALDKSDAPAAIKEGGSVGKRIWGSQEASKSKV